MDLIKMETATNKLAEAMAKAWPELKNAALNRTNPHFKSRYADLPAIIDAVRGPLAKHGLAFTQTTHLTEFGLVLRTTLLHLSGQSISSEYPLPMLTDKPQIMGGAMTYARRYSLAAICGISADDDLDGNDATVNGSGKPITAEQRAELIGMMEKTGADKARFCAHLGVEALDKLPASRFAEARTALEAKMKSKGAAQ